jgi:hypothetical protein
MPLNGICFFCPRANLPAAGRFTRPNLAGSFFALLTKDQWKRKRVYVSKFSNKLLLHSVLEANVNGNGNMFQFPSLLEMETETRSRFQLLFVCDKFTLNLWCM